MAIGLGCGVSERSHRSCEWPTHLPHDRVANERRRADEVGGDGREVERRDGKDEALERAVLGAVVHRLGVLGRLDAVQLVDELQASQR
jgi:hypothetical protein